MNGRRLGSTLILALLVVGSAIAQETSQQTEGTLPAAPDPSFVVGDPAGTPLSGEELDRKTKEVASLLRCPVCQGLSIWDSPATMAVNMKEQVRELLAEGYSREQVLEFFESSYGEFVRLAPAARGINWLVWIAPGALLLAGAWITWRILRRRSPDEEPGEEPEAETADHGEERLPGRNELPDDPTLAPYVLEVRRLAYGWPEGRSPDARGGDQ